MQAVPAAAVNENWDDDPDMEAEVRRLARQLKHRNIVSIAFIKQNKCTELIPYYALFDNGSPSSFLRRSI